MARLVALDLPWDDAFPAALAEVWEGGDAACVLDRRVAESARGAELATLSPTLRRGPHGDVVIDANAEVPDGTALVVASSGSSADPKAAVLSMAAVEASARLTSARLGVDPVRHRWLACTPLSHIGGLAVVARSLVTDTPVTVSAGPGRRHLGNELAEVSHAAVVSAMLTEADLSGLEAVLVGGAAPPSSLPPNAVATYGMTETGSGVVYDGIPLDGVELAVGADGEILLRSPTLATAYRDRTLPLVTLAGGEPWFPTGDVGSIGDDGRIEVRGRSGEVISTGGEQVWPADVERLLAEHAAVAEVAVTGRADERFGAIVVAHVVASDPAAPPGIAELAEVVRAAGLPWAVPRVLELHAALPRLGSGKVDRRALA